MSLELKVECHQILINSVHLLYDEPNIKILMVDFESKHPSIVGYAGSQVLYAKGEGSLHCNDETLKFSAIGLLNFPEEENWIAEAVVDRYTGFIFYFKGNFEGLNRPGKLLWKAE